MAASIFLHSEPRDGPQPFDPGRHIIQVADLVGEAFADELDDRGRNALREMRWAGRLSPMLGGMLSMALLNETFSGQVWVEGGRVVGNVTMQNIDQSGSRWRISNVAVAPAYRGRGIARALMQAALRGIAQRGGDWAVLQVVAENQIARQLYQKLHFEEIARSGAWQLATTSYRAPKLDPQLELRPLRRQNAGEWLTLAQSARSPLAQWAEPISAPDYQLGLDRLLGEALGRATGIYRVTRLGAWRNRRLVGVIEACAQPLSDYDTLRLQVHPEARGELEAGLVAQGLASLARPNARPVVVQHDGEHLEATAALRAAGFQVRRDLITMRKAITPADDRI